MKKQMKDAKLIEKIGRKHRTDPSSLTESTNVLSVQATMDHMIVQQDSNHMHPPMGISTPTLMVNNQLQMGPQQGQQQHPSPQIPPENQHANSPIRHNQFSQHFQQPPMPQVSPLMAPMQE